MSDQSNKLSKKDLLCIYIYTNSFSSSLGICIIQKQWLHLNYKRYLPGPSMEACMSVKSLSFMKTLIPSGGSDCNVCSCLATCRKTCGERFSEFDT